MFIKPVLLCFGIALISGCASKKPGPVAEPVLQKPEIATESERRAYAEGVRETMLDFAGKLRAEQRFVYEPSIMTCGVMVPGRIANGSFIPPHETCVMESRGRFKEGSPVVLPEIGAGQ